MSELRQDQDETDFGNRLNQTEIIQLSFEGGDRITDGEGAHCDGEDADGDIHSDDGLEADELVMGHSDLENGLATMSPANYLNGSDHQLVEAILLEKSKSN